MMIKVCGMREADNIREVEALGIDLMGFIFWSKSSRYVSERPAYLPTKCKRVGVFVDEDIETVKHVANEYALDFIQLHGHESPDYCVQLKGMHLIKAISVGSRDDIATYKTYEGLVDYFLFDTKCLSVGGSGQQFDWSVLSAYDGNTPFLLSGGIGPNDVVRLRASHYSSWFSTGHCIGIDLNSRFEIAPGLKDINKLNDFLNALNNE
jgi:phosphoribosylanthranilate isomerase